jgi:small subunit ribosomal protein S8
MTTDTIVDMLTRIRNANLAKHQRSFKLKNGLRSFLLLYLKYSGKERTPLITKITRASKPGLRVYSSSKKMPRILGGFGTAIVSTSRGLMTDKRAREEGVGGELLCYIW